MILEKGTPEPRKEQQRQEMLDHSRITQVGERRRWKSRKGLNTRQCWAGRYTIGKAKDGGDGAGGPHSERPKQTGTDLADCPTARRQASGTRRVRLGKGVRGLASVGSSGRQGGYRSVTGDHVHQVFRRASSTTRSCRASLAKRASQVSRSSGRVGDVVEMAWC